MQAAGQEEYGGPKPFSEPQTRIMKALAVDAQPRATVNIHSGEYALYVPWDSEPGQAAGLPVRVSLTPLCSLTSSEGVPNRFLIITMLPLTKPVLLGCSGDPLVKPSTRND